MIPILLIILFALLIFVGGDKGLDVVWTFFWNFITFAITVFLINLTGHPLPIALICCLVVSLLTLFYQNGYNIKTISSFISIFIVVISTILLIYSMTVRSGIQGFGDEYFEIDESYGYMGSININMMHIVIAVSIIALIGAILDTSLSISSATYEIYENAPHLSLFELFKSSMNVGKDILGTTVNTLFFIFTGDCFTLMVYYSKTSNFSQIINSKIFNQEVLQLLFSNLGCVLIIPVTAIISSWLFTRKKQTSSV